MLALVSQITLKLLGAKTDYPYRFLFPIGSDQLTNVFHGVISDKSHLR